MKNKGFTLVELLAVIAILAILVIMALPAVLKMYSKARIDSFSNEVNTVAKTARQQYLLDGGKNNIYSNADGFPKELPLTGNSNLKYYVEMDDQGKIIKLQVTNGEYQYNKIDFRGIDIISSEEIDIVSELADEDIIDGSGQIPSEYVYTDYGVRWHENQTISPVYGSYNSVINATGKNYFMRVHLLDKQKENITVWCIIGTNGSENYNSCDEWQYFETVSDCSNEVSSQSSEYEYNCTSQSAVITSGIIETLEFGFKLNDNIYYLEEGGWFNNNKAILASAFGEENCEERELGSGKESIPAYVCSINDFTITVQSGHIYPYAPINFFPGADSGDTLDKIY